MLEILRHRRSVRDFTDKPIAKETIDTLREAVLRAPTSRNRQPWQFIFVEQKELVEKLATSKSHGTRFLETAQLALVIVADPEVSDVWVEDCSIAAIIAQLAAEELGLKSCWGQLRLRTHDENSSASNYVCELLDIPTEFEVPIIIGFGYPIEMPQGYEHGALPWGKLHRNRFNG
jgi:nitroreductase